MNGCLDARIFFFRFVCFHKMHPGELVWSQTWVKVIDDDRGCWVPLLAGRFCLPRPTLCCLLFLCVLAQSCRGYCSDGDCMTHLGWNEWIRNIFLSNRLRASPAVWISNCFSSNQIWKVWICSFCTLVGINVHRKSQKLSNPHLRVGPRLLEVGHQKFSWGDVEAMIQ